MTSQIVQFRGSTGLLAGIVETPEGPPASFAIYAHCFTCGKDLKSAAVIARTLARHGIQTLRFDFTGVGLSEGGPREATFTNHVQDVVCAAAFLAERGQAPQLLVGHSLGGAAVLCAAGEIETVRAVATLATPAQTNLLADRLERLLPPAGTCLEPCEGHTTFAGKPIHFHAELIRDLRQTDLRAQVAALGRPLLVLHSPHDDVVPFDQALQLFAAANHPKSLVSIDSRDHLLLDPGEAAHVADLIAIWARPALS